MAYLFVIDFKLFRIIKSTNYSCYIYFDGSIYILGIEILF